jgi:hypothetical protein
LLLTILPTCTLADEKDYTPLITKAVEKSTLNQRGIEPFHLKAEIAPSLPRDRDSGRTGEVEIWWESSTKWRREVRSPEFHQIDVINGDQEWQKNEGEYFPEWLREIAVELIEPVPYFDEVMKQAEGADVKSLLGNLYFQWSMDSTDGHAHMEMGGSVAITERTGLLFYGGGFGWGGLFEDYRSFHGRMVARRVAHGTPEARATVVTLEDLKPASENLFDTKAPDGDAQLLRTVRVDELSERKNLIHEEAVEWPPLKDGPLEGAVTTEVCIDRTGKVRETTSIVSQNLGLIDVARRAILAMEFKPYLVNGIPVQVVTRITMVFKTLRPK